MENNNKDREIECNTVIADNIKERYLLEKVKGYGHYVDGVLSKINSPKTMPKKANTYLYVEGDDVRFSIYKDGSRIADFGITKGISDIQVINEKIVIVTFADGNTEKAVLDLFDAFSLEQGIAICIMKNIFSRISYGNGSSVYNKLVEYGLKMYNDIENTKLEAEIDRQKREAKAKKKTEKARRNRERKAAEKREAEIEIQKEAYLRAMREFKDTSNTVVENN